MFLKELNLHNVIKSFNVLETLQSPYNDCRMFNTILKHKTCKRSNCTRYMCYDVPRETVMYFLKIFLLSHFSKTLSIRGIQTWIVNSRQRSEEIMQLARNHFLSFDKGTCIGFFGQYAPGT